MVTSASLQLLDPYPMCKAYAICKGPSEEGSILRLIVVEREPEPQSKQDFSRYSNFIARQFAELFTSNTKYKISITNNRTIVRYCKIVTARLM